MNTARTIIMLSFLLNLFACSTPNVASCFDSDQFDTILRYSTWKMQTNKTIHVMVNDFEMEVLPKRVIAFKQDGYTIARVSKEDGITLLPVKQSDRLTNSVHEAYCALSKRAKIWGEQYK